MASTDFSKLLTEDERFIRRCADEAEAHRRVQNGRPEMQALRKWAIERLLTAELGPSMMAPGWIVQEQGMADLKPGQVMSMHEVPVPRMTRIPPPIFGLADSLVAYVLSGEHPKAMEGEA